MCFLSLFTWNYMIVVHLNALFATSFSVDNMESVLVWMWVVKLFPLQYFLILAFSMLWNFQVFFLT